MEIFVQKFTQLGFKLLPNSSKELKTSCNSPDSANPCKHIASVYYILGERFDEDPFLLFELRGIQKEPLLELLRKQRASGKINDIIPVKAEEEEQVKLEDVVSRNLSLKDVENYWGNKTKTNNSIRIQDDSSSKVDILQKLAVIHHEKDIKNTNDALKILKELIDVLSN